MTNSATLDVVLYRRDRKGRLRLEERVFATFGGLVLFFSTEESRRWEWAEVATMRRAPASEAIVRYSAEQLRLSRKPGPKSAVWSAN